MIKNHFIFDPVQLFLILLGLNDTSTLVGNFVWSPRKREKRDRRVNRIKRGTRKKKEQEYKLRNHFIFDPVQFFLTLLGLNDTSTLVGHFVWSPRKREKRDRRVNR